MHNQSNNGSNYQQQHPIERRDIVLPIKRLLLKYFEESSTYEQKVNTLNTLCEVLDLDKK